MDRKEAQQPLIEEEGRVIILAP